MRSLPLYFRIEGRPVILLGDGDGAAAKRRLLERAGAEIVGEDHSAQLAIVAIDDEAEALAAIARLKARGVLVNATDRPDHCDFTIPAIIDRDPVVVAIGTDGASAGLAKAMRQRLEDLLPQSLGRLADALQSVRAAMRQRWPDAKERRHAIDAALDPAGGLDPFSDNSSEAVTQWLANATPGRISQFYRVELFSDDPDDLTIRQARLLGQADFIYHTTGVATGILDRARADALRVACESPPDPPPNGLTLFLDKS